MLIEPLLQLLGKLKLHGMLSALQRQLSDPDIGALRFEERLNLLLQHELAERDNYRLTQRLRVAALPQPACLEDLDQRIPRNLDPALLATVRDLGWIGRHLNLLITGPTGIGKSFIAAALAHAACRANYAVRCCRLPRLIDGWPDVWDQVLIVCRGNFAVMQRLARWAVVVNTWMPSPEFPLTRLLRTEPRVTRGQAK